MSTEHALPVELMSFGGPIHVVTASDDGYAQHLAVMLLSLFDRQISDCRVHVIVPEDFASGAKLLAMLGERVGNVTFHPISAAALIALPTRPDITVATYFRLLMDTVLPSDIPRVIFLDSDIIVRDDLEPLWRTPLGGATIGAVVDPGFEHHHVLGIDGAPYFNAGMMLIDMMRWRRDRVGEAALHVAASEPERLTWGDQCALNLVLQGRWKLLDPAWNMQGPHLDTSLMSGRRILHIVPRIVHFTSPSRPWLHVNEHPFKLEYQTYLKKTPWHAYKEPDRNIDSLIKKNLSLYCWKIKSLYQKIRRILGF